MPTLLLNTPCAPPVGPCYKHEWHFNIRLFFRLIAVLLGWLLLWRFMRNQLTMLGGHISEGLHDTKPGNE